MHLSNIINEDVADNELWRGSFPTKKPGNKSYDFAIQNSSRIGGLKIGEKEGLEDSFDASSSRSQGLSETLIILN